MNKLTTPGKDIKAKKSQVSPSDDTTERARPKPQYRAQWKTAWLQN